MNRFKEKYMVTIKDIAREAGVSCGTVSNVLNAKGNVSSEKTNRVQEAIAQNKQIIFRYFDWDLGGKRKYRDRSYQASPYGLCQDNENCYLLAHSLRHGVTALTA